MTDPKFVGFSIFRKNKINFKIFSKAQQRENVFQYHALNPK